MSLGGLMSVSAASAACDATNAGRLTPVYRPLAISRRRVVCRRCDDTID